MPAASAASSAIARRSRSCVSGSDPVRAGLVASFNPPGGNVTGVYVLLTGLEGKRPGLLRDLVPQASLIGMLINPRSPDAEAQSRALQGAARAVGQEVLSVAAGRRSRFDRGPCARSRGRPRRPGDALASVAGIGEDALDEGE